MRARSSWSGSARKAMGAASTLPRGRGEAGRGRGASGRRPRARTLVWARLSEGGANRAPPSSFPARPRLRPMFEELIRAWDGEEVVIRYDPPTSTWMFVGVHSTVLGPGMGGTRMKVYAVPAAG